MHQIHYRDSFSNIIEMHEFSEINMSTTNIGTFNN